MLEPRTFDRIPKDTPYSIERGYFPSLVERKETFVAYIERGYWIDIGTPEKYVGVHRDIFAGRCPLGPAGIASGQPVVAPDARIEAGAVLEGPCFVDAGATIKAGARIGRLQRDRPQRHGRGGRAGVGRDRVAEHADRPRRRRRRRDHRPQLPRRPRGPRRCRRAILGDKTALTDFTQV